MDNMEMLLTEYWRGALDPSRQQEVEAWIEASPENREKAMKYCRLEQCVTEYSLLQNQDEKELLYQADRLLGLESGRREVSASKSKAKKGSVAPPSRVRKGWLYAISLAAAAILIVFGGWMGLRRPIGKMDEENLFFRTGCGECAEFLLPDQTKVWLNSNSTLSYPKAFKHKNREVRLEGEAFFDVSHDARHPFIVYTEECRVKVLGTQFDVVAYPDNGSDFYTTLVSGSVEMTLKTGGRNRSTTLVPGQRFSYDTENDRASVSYVDTESLTSWRTGCIMFRHTSLKDVLSMIGNNFGIRFVINNPSLLNDTYSGSFDHQPLDEILSTLEQVTDLHFKPLVVTEEDSYPRYIVY